MIDTKRELSLGEKGEYLAKCYLEKKGYIFIRANYRTKHGEIDLIMQDNNEIVFIEVKTRTLHSALLYGRGTDKIDAPKRQHISYSAKTFMYIEKRFAELTPRFDTIELYIDTDTDKIHINHIESAF